MRIQVGLLTRVRGTMMLFTNRSAQARAVRTTGVTMGAPGYWGEEGSQGSREPMASRNRR